MQTYVGSCFVFPKVCDVLPMSGNPTYLLLLSKCMALIEYRVCFMDLVPTQNDDLGMVLIVR